MLKRIRILVFVLALWVARSNAEPIKLHPANPHYYLFKGQPTILITSAEHYGAVINKDFDYVTYFDALKSYGLNYTRIYPGAMFEPMGKFIKQNPLGPKPASLVVPMRARARRQRFVLTLGVPPALTISAVSNSTPLSMGSRSAISIGVLPRPSFSSSLAPFSARN